MEPHFGSMGTDGRCWKWNVFRTILLQAAGLSVESIICSFVLCKNIKYFNVSPLYKRTHVTEKGGDFLDLLACPGFIFAMQAGKGINIHLNTCKKVKLEINYRSSTISASLLALIKMKNKPEAEKQPC